MKSRDFVIIFFEVIFLGAVGVLVFFFYLKPEVDKLASTNIKMVYMESSKN